MNFNAPVGLPKLGITEGAATPVPTEGAGAMIWSTALKRRMVWTGSIWSSSVA